MTEPIIGPGPNDYGRERSPEVIAEEVKHVLEALSASFSLAKENQEMRLALCMAHAGAGAYLDDGEMQDSTKHPMIDWKRDPWETIKAKLVERGRAALAKACPDAVRMAPTYQPLFTQELMDAGPEAIEKARQEGLQKLQAEIDAGAVKIEDLSPESADLVIAENRRKLEAEGVLPVTDADLNRFSL